MKIKITNQIIGYDGIPYREKLTTLTDALIAAIKTSPKEELIASIEKLSKEPLTFRDIFNTALNSYAKDEVLSAQDKSKCYELTKKCFDFNEPDFTQSQITFIIDRVEKIYVLPLIIGRVKEIFEDEPEAKIK